MMSCFTVHIVVDSQELCTSVSAIETLAELLEKESARFWTAHKCQSCECNTFPVILDGKLVNANYIFASDVDYAKVETLNKMLKDPALSSLWAAFDEQKASYSYCLPRAKVAIASLLRQNTSPTYEDIRLSLSGNLCKCTNAKKIECAAKDLFEIVCRHLSKAKGSNK